MADLGLGVNQLKYATVIIRVGKARNESPRNITIAMMTAITESGLQNYANQNVPSSLAIPHDAVGSDHASLGIFQQQTPGWGTPQELMTPEVATAKFYDALDSKGDTTKETPWAAAQSVQGSSFSDGSNYQANWQRAQDIVSGITGTSDFLSGQPTGGKVTVDPTAPFPVGQFNSSMKLTTDQRAKMLAYLGKNWTATSPTFQELTGYSDGALINIYNDNVQKGVLHAGDPGAAIAGIGPNPIASWTAGLAKLLGWLSNKDNWKRIGLFGLGAILLLVAALYTLRGEIASTVKAVSPIA